MGQLTKVFTYESAEVRSVMVEGTPWFIAKDICVVLELSNPTIAMQRLDSDEVAKFNLGAYLARLMW